MPKKKKISEREVLRRANQSSLDRGDKWLDVGGGRRALAVKQRRGYRLTEDTPNGRRSGTGSASESVRHEIQSEKNVGNRKDK